MNKYNELFDYLDGCISTAPDNIVVMYQEVKSYFDKEDKPLFTEAGLQILEYLQSHPDENLKAKDIADGMEISSRKVSGAIRKLVTDGYVGKSGQNPVIYHLTEQGKNFKL